VDTFLCCSEYFQKKINSDLYSLTQSRQCIRIPNCGVLMTPKKNQCLIHFISMWCWNISSPIHTSIIKLPWFS